jgi:hypothetical protein
VAAGLTTASGSYYAIITTSTTAGLAVRAAVPVYITPYAVTLNGLVKFGVVGPAAKCTAVAAPVAACQAANDYYYAVPIVGSSVTFGSVLLQVLTSTGATYSATTHGAFAISTTAAPGTADATWVAASPYSMAMTSSNFWTFAGGFTTKSPLTSSYEFSIDMGTVNPAGDGYTFVANGFGSYYGSTLPVAIP